MENLDVRLDSSCLSQNGNIRVHERLVLAQAFRQDGGLRLSHGEIPEILDAISGAVRCLSHSLYGYEPHEGAINKCRGFWFEIIVAWVINNISAKDNAPICGVRLGSNRGGDGFAPLLCDNMRMAINPECHLASNPDLLVLSAKCKRFLSPKEFKWLNINRVDTLADRHQKLVGLLGPGDIRGAISVKVSLRPDRKELLPQGGMKFKATMEKAWRYGARKLRQRIKKDFKPEYHNIVAGPLGNTTVLRQQTNAMDKRFPIDSTTQTRTFKELRDALIDIGRSCMGKKKRRGVFVGRVHTEELLEPR